jgi:hypothetical protein
MTAEPEAQQNLRLLKVVVIVLGVLILLSGALLVAGIYRKMSGAAPAPVPAAAAPLPARPASGEPVPLAGPAGGAARFGDRQLTLPRGARLVEMLTAGDRLVLRVRLATGSERLFVYDVLSGEPTGSLEIGTAD